MKEYAIPFGGRAHQYTEDEIATVVSIMKSPGSLTQGQSRDRFEQKVRKYTGVNHAFAVNTATSALDLAASLCQLELDTNAEIISPGHTFTSSVYPFVKKGARVVWADIDPKTHVVSAEFLEAKLSEKTRALIVPHLYGYACDMDEITQFADDNKIVLIEDAAQAFGSEFNGQKAGSFGDFGIYSFHSHKNISTLGEGGMLLVRDLEHARLVPMLRHNGHCEFREPREDYWIPAMGDLDIPSLNGQLLWPSNFCLGEAECALGEKLIDRADQINAEKRSRAIRFIDELSDFYELVFLRENTKRHNYHLLVGEVIGLDRDAFIRRMANHHGIQCVVQYCPLYRYPFYKKLGLGAADCPNTEKFFDRMVSFPFSHLLRDDEIDAILEATKETIRFLRRS